MAAACLIALMASGPAAAVPAYVEPLNGTTLDEIRGLYKRLIDAENLHDLKTVRPLVWTSPSTLFVAKTATPAEGNWAGFWGTDGVMEHFGDLYNAGSFPIDPDYSRRKL
jgi:hypothetical protein